MTGANSSNELETREEQDIDSVPLLPWCGDCWSQSSEGTKDEHDNELPAECQHCGSTEVFWI